MKIREKGPNRKSLMAEFAKTSIFILVFLVVGVFSDDCPSGFVRHDESCYALIRVKASWAEATVYCSAVGAHLVVIETDTEHSYIQSYAQRESASIDVDGVWIGGMDYLVEQDWQWGPTRNRIDKAWWNPSQPDGMKGENCIIMYKSFNFNWDDYFCQNQEYFMCEMESPTTNPIG